MATEQIKEKPKRAKSKDYVSFLVFLTKKDFEELNGAWRACGYMSRSELCRAAIKGVLEKHAADEKYQAEMSHRKGSRRAS